VLSPSGWPRPAWPCWDLATGWTQLAAARARPVVARCVAVAALLSSGPLRPVDLAVVRLLLTPSRLHACGLVPPAAAFTSRRVRALALASLLAGRPLLAHATLPHRQLRTFWCWL
jgi:hypothetical protein